MTEKRGAGFWPVIPILWKTALWTGILLVVPTCATALGASPYGGPWTLWEGLYLGSEWIGFLLPFAAFAGGLTVSRALMPGRLACSALLISALAFLLSGQASPGFEYRAQAAKGFDVDAHFPTGPGTVGNLRALRSQAMRTPPDEFSFSVGRPLDLPPNWITYLIHSTLGLAFLAILTVFLGSVTAGLTTGLSPPARRNARWAIGLASGVLFFVAEATGGDWVRANPQHSGVLGAWLPLLLPMAELGLLYLLLHRSRSGSTLSQGLPSYD